MGMTNATTITQDFEVFSEQLRSDFAELLDASDDAERAHSIEDRLRADALRFIAERAPEPFCTIARAALKTDEVSFARWCA